MSNEPIWYYIFNNEKHGPCSWAQVSDAVLSKSLPFDIMVWAPHLTNWRPFSSLLQSSSPSPQSPIQVYVNYPQTESRPTSVQQNNNSHWTSITSFILGLVVNVIGMATPKWDKDATIGGIILGVIPIIFGLISISIGKSGRWMAITGVILGSIMILISLGSM